MDVGGGPKAFMPLTMTRNATSAIHAHRPVRSRGTVAREYTGEVAEPARAPAVAPDAATLDVRKPSGHAGH